MEINGRRKIISKEFKPPENKKLTEEEMLNNRINGDRIMAGYGEMPVLDSEYIFKNDRPLEIFEYYDLPIFTPRGGQFAPPFFLLFNYCSDKSEFGLSCIH